MAFHLYMADEIVTINTGVMGLQHQSPVLEIFLSNKLHYSIIGPGRVL